MLGRMLCALVLIALAACAGTVEEADTIARTSEAAGAADLMPAGEPCPEVRPQICTLQYDPVCGWGEGDFYGDYGNFCGACGDERVLRVVEGRCPEATD